MKRALYIPVLLCGMAFGSGCGLIKKAEEQQSTPGARSNGLFTPGQEVGVNNSDLGTDLAQSFTTGTSDMTILYVDLPMKRPAALDNVANDLFVYIQRDLGGVPDNVTIGQGTRKVVDVTNGANPVAFRFTLTSATTLTKNTKYWIRLSSNLPSQNSAGSLVKWAGSSGDVFRNGEAKYLSGATWSNTAGVAATNFSGANYDFSFTLAN